MPKQKTHKGVAKRVKITAKGKVKRKKAGMGHLMSCKTSKRRRQLGNSTLVKTATADTMKTMLGKG